MMIKLLTDSAKTFLPEVIKYTSSPNSNPWGKVIDYALDVIPLTGYPKQALKIAKKIYDFYEAISTLGEGKKALEKSINNLEAAMNEYQRQINEASAAGLLSNYIVPLQKQLLITQQKHRQMMELLYSMTNAIKKAQAKIIFLEGLSKKDKLF